MRAGRFGADVLILWESSRGSRKVGEWVELIDLCEQQRVSIFVTTHGREYKRAAAANARAGLPYGRIAYGYARRYDERTRKIIAQEPHPDEAPIVVELFARLKEGHAFKAIARDFAARGC